MRIGTTASDQGFDELELMNSLARLGHRLRHVDQHAEGPSEANLRRAFLGSVDHRRTVRGFGLSNSEVRDYG